MKKIAAMAQGRCRDLGMGSFPSVANVQSLPRFPESTTNPPSQELQRVLLGRAYPYKDSDSYVSYNSDCQVVSIWLLHKFSVLKRQPSPTHTIEGNSRHNGCVYACRSHNLCVIWYGYYVVSSRPYMQLLEINNIPPARRSTTGASHLDEADESFDRRRRGLNE
jgi:hypothetical protein